MLDLIRMGKVIMVFIIFVSLFLEGLIKFEKDIDFFKDKIILRF